MKLKIFSHFFLPLIFFLFFVSCTKNDSVPNILTAPYVISVNNTNNIAAVADVQNNNLSLINISNNSVIGGAPLLNSGSTLRIPTLPQDIATYNLGNGVTRIFLIGTGDSPSNTIVVLDYNPSTTLTAASISPITVGSGTSDELLGLAVNSTLGVIYVSDSTTSRVHAFDANTGTEVSGSPLAVQTSPGKMHWNPSTSQLVVSSLDTNSISFIDTTDLTQAVQTLDVGAPSNSVASATNSNGTALFVIEPNDNEVFVYNLNVNTPSASTQIRNILNPDPQPIVPITPPALGSTLSSTDVLSGAATLMTAGPLSSGVIGGFFTQSTGDMGYVDVAADLSGYSAGRVTTLNGQNAYGISLQTDSSGNALNAYFAAPGGGAVTYINVVSNLFSGQIL